MLLSTNKATGSVVLSCSSYDDASHGLSKKIDVSNDSHFLHCLAEASSLYLLLVISLRHYFDSYLVIKHFS